MRHININIVISKNVLFLLLVYSKNGPEDIAAMVEIKIDF